MVSLIQMYKGLIHLGWPLELLTIAIVEIVIVAIALLYAAGFTRPRSVKEVISVLTGSYMLLSMADLLNLVLLLILGVIPDLILLTAIAILVIED